ncbi:MAG: hypothetical protein RR623_10225 [Bacilli bacterium]
MISDELAVIVSKRLNYDLEKTKYILQDFDDRWINKALKVDNSQCMRSLTLFLEEYTEDLNVLAHLRGFKDKEEQIACWNQYDKEMEGLSDN